MSGAYGKETSGGYCGGVPPLPIPNADGTAMQCGRVGSRLLSRTIAPRIAISSGLFVFITVSMSRIKRWIVWLSRWRHCRGFGVQSPNDYSFIRYVINEHYPYYAYVDLRTALPDIDPLLRKKAELVFRLANWKQSSYIVVDEDNEVYRRYILEGCRKSVVTTDMTADTDFFLLSTRIHESDDFVRLLKTDRMIVVDYIHDRHGKSVWRDLISSEKATITFDLYYVGIVFTFDKRYKHDYIVNF